MVEERIFTSFDEFRQTYFPKSYEKEQRDEQIKEQGFGNYLVRQIIEDISGELNKNL